MEKPSKAVLDLREIAADFDGDRIAKDDLQREFLENWFRSIMPVKTVKTRSRNKKNFVYDLKFENKIKKGRRKNKAAAESRKRNRN